jgi:hypothetical protein
MENEDDSLDCVQDVEKLLEYKDIESDFYSNHSLNDDLESKF